MAANTFLCISVGYYIFFLLFFTPLQEECVLSDPQGESDADADIEDTDCRSPTCSYSHSVLRSALLYLTLCLWLNLFRLQEPGSLQRISSRRRKRPRVARQDTTESEDDGGRSHRSHRWNLRLSPDRAHSRTILEVRINKLKKSRSSNQDVIVVQTFGFNWRGFYSNLHLNKCMYAFSWILEKSVSLGWHQVTVENSISLPWKTFAACFGSLSIWTLKCCPIKLAAFG